MFECFPSKVYRETIDHRGLAKFDPRAMIATIYNGDSQTLLHTKYRSSGPCGFREEEFFSFPPSKVYGDYRPPGRGQI